MSNKVFFFLAIFLIVLTGFSQLKKAKSSLNGQVSVIGNVNPSDNIYFLGARYIPTLSYGFKLDTTKKLDFEASANLSSSVLFYGNDSTQTNVGFSSYRLWARYSDKRYELRIGLQKIDFGSATLIRPLQWFNQIDPRDPLQLTRGVYAVLGRYYFKNNANVWIWSLYGNEKTRGFDIATTDKNNPEFGGRFQYPVPKGEIAFSYHHRTANLQYLGDFPYDKVGEDRIGIDGKWDVKVGLWFELSHIHKSKNIGVFTNQSLANLGTDYTFKLGNGLNVIVEHFLITYNSNAYSFDNHIQLTATTMRYSLGFYDNISSIIYYNWQAENSTLFLNYEHQFPKFTTYLMYYYSPSTQQGIINNDLVNIFAGHGLRLMLVYNH